MDSFVAGKSGSPKVAESRTPAAKLHVLHLDPIKDRLGDKWPKLSSLVHKLFESTIRETQGPRDHFIHIEELSYVVTFHGLAFEEASLACAAIAQQVCEKLFGETIADVSVRALVGEFPADILSAYFRDGRQISNQLELNGKEIIVSSNAVQPPPTRTRISPGASESDWEPLTTIEKAAAQIRSFGLEIGLFPIWDMPRNKSSCVYILPYYQPNTPVIGSTRKLLAGMSDKVIDVEITLLLAAHAYTQRLHNERQVCAVGAPVSYETLTNLATRIRYITALKTLTIPSECPIMLKIERVPAGTPIGRLAELISMLSLPNVRFTVLFESAAAIPDKVDIRLGAVGNGFVLPPNTEVPRGVACFKRLAHSFSEQKGFLFVEGLDSPDLCDAAKSQGIRFGSGRAFGEVCLKPWANVPNFPLRAS